MTTTDHPLTTPLGDILVKALSKDEIFVDANSDGKFLTIRGQDVTTLFWLTRIDGTWQVLAERGINPKIKWPHRHAFQSASPAAAKSIEDKVVPVVIDWAEAHPEEFIEAEVRRAEMDVAQTAREREATQKAYQMADKAWDAACHRHQEAWAAKAAYLGAVDA